jgi:hypothetical protein
VPVLEFDAEHRIRQRLDDRAFEHDRILLGLWQVTLPGSSVVASARQSPRRIEGYRKTVSSRANAVATRQLAA